MIHATESRSKRHAHFSMTGKDLTRIARDLVLDDRPELAYQTLAKGLLGKGASEAAIRILQGQSKLVGSMECLRLTTERKSKSLDEFKRKVNFIYAGRIKTQGAWVRPVEWIDSDDVEKLQRSHAIRYARPGGAIELLDVPGEGKRWVVFEQCSERPMWQDSPAGMQEALEEFIVAGRSIGVVRADAIQDGDLDDIFGDPEQEWEESEQEEREDREERKDREWDSKLAKIADAVREQAGDNTFVMTLLSGREVKVPRAPFVRWALRRTDLEDAAPEWANIAESGLKLPLDSRDHSDWVLGSGLTLEEAYTDEVIRPAYDAMFEIQEEIRSSRESKRPYAGIFAALDNLRSKRIPAACIIDNGEVTGVVGSEILVFPDSDGRRVAELGNCKGIVVEQGGPLAHLVITSKGLRITVMRHPNALELLRPGSTITLNPSSGRITVLEAKAEDTPGERP